jgi:hypothetical protein
MRPAEAADVAALRGFPTRLAGRNKNTIRFATAVFGAAPTLAAARLVRRFLQNIIYWRLVPPLRILVRSDVDWDRMSDAAFVAQDDDKRPLFHIHGALRRDVLDVWRRSFPIDFFVYRGLVRRIAQQTLERAGADAISFGFGDFSHWYGNDEDEIIAPIDDDDFYSPRLREVRDAFTPNTDIVVWTHARVGFLDLSPIRSCQLIPVPVLCTNNWAVRKSFMRRVFDVDEAMQVFAHHRKGNNLIARKLGLPAWTPQAVGLTFLFHRRVRLVEQVYAAYNEHPGSIAFLARLLHESEGGASKLSALDLNTRAFLPEGISDLESSIRALEGALHRASS